MFPKWSYNLSIMWGPSGQQRQRIWQVQVQRKNIYTKNVHANLVNTLMNINKFREEKESNCGYRWCLTFKLDLSLFKYENLIQFTCLHCSTLIATEYVNISVMGIENIVKHFLHWYKFSGILEQFQYKKKLQYENICLGLQ